MSDATDAAPGPEIHRPSAVTGGPGLLVLNGHTLILRHPTPADFFALWDYAKELAAAGTRTPLQAIAADLEHLPPQFQSEAIRAAVAQASGSKAAEPTREAIQEKALSYEGDIWFTWWLAREAHPNLTPDQLKAWFPPDARYDLRARVMEATRLADKKDPKAPSGSVPGSAS